MKKYSHLNFYNFIWIFTFSAFTGWLIELGWRCARHGCLYFQGFVHAPMLPIYGVGGLILFILFTFYKKKNIILTFLIGFILLSGYEYFVSWFQEVAFGTWTWDYDGFSTFHLNGRISLLHSTFFGTGAVLWQFLIQERAIRFLDGFVKGKIKIITILLTIFLAINIILTVAATIRISERANDIPPSNCFWEFIDQQYNDEFMRRWLPKIRVIRN